MRVADAENISINDGRINKYVWAVLGLTSGAAGGFADWMVTGDPRSGILAGVMAGGLYLAPMI